MVIINIKIIITIIIFKYNYCNNYIMSIIKHLVISGGGPTMIQTLGSIQHLEENKFIDFNNIETIYGTSAGAIIGVLICLKYDWTTLYDYIIKRPWHEVFPVIIQIIFDDYTNRPQYHYVEKYIKPIETFGRQALFVVPKKETLNIHSLTDSINKFRYVFD